VSRAPAIARGATRLALAATAGGALVVLLIYLPPLAAPFLVPKTAALELAAALGFTAFALRRAVGGAAAAPLSPPLGWAAAAVLATTLLAWAAAARAPEGAPYAPAALARWASLFGIAAGAAVVARDAGARRALLDAVTAGAAVVSAIGLVQHLELAVPAIPVISAPGSTFGNRNLAGEAVALALPFGLAGLALAVSAGAARRRGELACFAAALALEAIYLAATRARGAWLGGAAGVVTFALLARPRLPRAALFAAAAAALVAAVVALVPLRSTPVLASDTKRFASGLDVVEASFDPRSTALRTRAGLWRRTFAMWRDHALVGVGPGNWPRFFPRYAEPGAMRDGVLTATVAPLQAHDDLLERAAETGIVGLGALVALAVAAAAAARRSLRAAADARERAVPAAGAGALVALAAASLTGFPLEMPGTLLLGGVALGLVAPASERPERAAAAAPAWLGAALGAALAVLAVASAVPQVRGSYWMARAERLFHRDGTPQAALDALPALARAQAATPRQFSAWLHAAQAELRLARDADAEAAARRALALEPWSPNAWAVLGAAQLRRDPASARASAERALAILQNHPLGVSVLARAAAATGDEGTAGQAAARLRALSDPNVGSTDRQTADAARDLLPFLPGVSVR
jgi:O-antigen ligase